MPRGTRRLDGVFGEMLDDLLGVVRRRDTSVPRHPRRRPPGAPPTKTDKIKEHLTQRDLDAARRELDGEVVARKADGTPWDHVNEVRDAQRGLRNRIRQLQQQLGNPDLAPAARAEAQRELGEASRLLDRSREFVP